LLLGSLSQVLECLPASLDCHASSCHVFAEVAEVDPIVGYANKPHACCNAVSHLPNNLVSRPTHVRNEILYPNVTATPCRARPGPASEIISATPSQDNTVMCRERVPSASSPRSARHPSYPFLILLLLRTVPDGFLLRRLSSADAVPPLPPRLFAAHSSSSHSQYSALRTPPSATMSLQSLSRAARVILVGAPGVGKGTQTERLMNRFPDLASISSGDLLRKNVRERTPLGMACNMVRCYRIV
jgi:hypothetical protein